MAWYRRPTMSTRQPAPSNGIDSRAREMTAVRAPWSPHRLTPELEAWNKKAKARPAKIGGLAVAGGYSNQDTEAK